MFLGFIAVGFALLGRAEHTAVAQDDPPTVPFPSSCNGVSVSRYQYTVANNWQVTKIKGGLRQPRTIIFDTAGNMLVLEQTRGISAHTFGADGCISSSKNLLQLAQLNHGLSLTPDGTKLYASSQNQVWEWDYDASTLTLSNQRVVVRGMGSGIHSTRTTVVAPNNPNVIVVSVGSNSNWDMAAADIRTGRACIRAFDVSTAPSGGWNYNTDGWPMGYGLRNSVGITFDPNGMGWAVENSGDDFRRTVNGQSVDIHIDEPAEELNYLGDPSEPNDNWYGYPTCFTVGTGQAIQGGTFTTGDQFVPSPNASFGDAACAGASVPARLTFPAHSAPISNAFDKAGENMYVTLHGSWNRQPSSGYKVVEIPFTSDGGADGGYAPVATVSDRAGFNDVMWANNPAQCNSPGLTISTCFRLAALAWDLAGTRLFVSSDNQAEGEIWVLAKK